MRGHVAVLMATRNGASYLGPQIASVLEQTHSDLMLYISDDGSTDATLRIAAEFAATSGAGRIRLRDGPRQGCTRNFLTLLCDRTVTGDYFAFSDQDDVWLPQKLDRALNSLSAADRRPALYGARTIVTDAALRPIGLSPRFLQRPCFRNALVQNIAGGNTMVMNSAARCLLAAVCGRTDPVAHDWWCYQVISGAGGVVIHDPEPVLFYRQHGGNLVGANQSVGARISRIAAVAGGRFATWNTQNLLALEQIRPHLTPEAQNSLDRFEALRRLRGGKAIRALRDAGLSRQTWLSNLSLSAAAALGRL